MKKVLSMLLSFAMLISLIPTTVFAEETSVVDTETTENSSGIALDKKVTLNNDGTYTITLEAYAEGEEQTVYTPMDILFVIDQSGSMLQVDDASKTIYVDGNGDGDIVADLTLYESPAFTTGGVDIDGDGSITDSDKSVNITGLSETGNTQYYTMSTTNDEDGNITRTYNELSDTAQLLENARISGYYINATSTMIKTWNTYYPVLHDLTVTDSDNNSVNYPWANVVLKYQKKNANGDLNTYFSVKDYQGNITYEAVAEDFVLAKTRYGIVTDVTTNFINKVHDLASSKSTDHRMGLVGFSGDGLNEFDGTALYITNNDGSWTEYSYNNQDTITAQYVNAFRSVKNDNYFLNTMRDYKAFAQQTRQDLGLTMANKVFAATDYKSDANKDRKKIVIFITDGAPSPGDVTDITSETVLDASTANSSNQVMNNSIEQANALKGSDVEVYSIGILRKDSSGNVDATMKEMLERISSNYSYVAPTTTELEDGTTETTTVLTNGKIGGTTQADKTGYCNIVTADSTLETELQKIFDSITDNVTASTTTLSSEAVLKDIIADDFTLPEGFSAENNVTVETVDYLGNGKWAEESEEYADAKVSFVNTDNETSISVTNFDYAENYIADALEDAAARGKKLVVTIEGILAKGSAAQNEPVATNGSASGIYKSAGSTSPAALFPQPETILTTKAYVLDFGKKVEVSPSDWTMDSITGLDDANPKNSDEVMVTSTTETDVSVDLKYGKAEKTVVVNTDTNESFDKLVYTPQTMNWDGYDSVFVFGESTDSKITSVSANATGKLWSRVDFIPATSVYYEDTFETNEDGVTGITYTGSWSAEKFGITSGTTQSSDNTINTIYGTDASYDGNFGYSDGSAHTAEAGAKAEFTFTGTGVDIYTSTNKTSGQVLVQAVGQSEGGKTYTAWIDNEFKSIEGGLYQIPTVAFENMERDTYKVTLTVLSDKKENSTYYLDAIRIYNPIDETTDSLVKQKYEEAGEDDAITFEVRDELIAAEDFDVTDELNGVVYIDNLNNSTNSIANYVDIGPKNEVYLAPGKAIAFEVTSNYKNLYVGLKTPSRVMLVDGTEVLSQVTVSDGDSSKNITINSATDMYYKITPKTVTVTENESETTKNYVVIENTGNTLIAITKIRLATYEQVSTAQYTLRASRLLMSYVQEFMGEEDTIENPFTDVSEDAYYYDAVLWAVENGITNGVSATEFGTGNVCTRAQAVTFLWRAAGSPEPTATTTSFTDVAENSYYYKAVLWAVENGITHGTSANKFNPDAECTREQIVTFLWRAMN